MTVLDVHYITFKFEYIFFRWTVCYSNTANTSNPWPLQLLYWCLHQALINLKEQKNPRKNKNLKYLPSVYCQNFTIKGNTSHTKTFSYILLCDGVCKNSPMSTTSGKKTRFDAGKIGFCHCTAVLQTQVPKSCTDLDLSHLHFDFRNIWQFCPEK